MTEVSSIENCGIMGAPCSVNFPKNSSNPDQKEANRLIISSLDFFYALNWRVFGVLVIVLAFLDS